jgi:hydrophobic/amphiphilic exporter-1 (mainly G- bacteria), HAE1 family
VNITGLFIRRPVMTTLTMTAILLFGLFGYKMLPVSDLPTVDFPTIQVNASLPGANPETMAAAVATPLEQQFSTIAGLDNMSSTSGQGSTQITLQFNLNRNIDAAAQDVQSMISKAGRNLPPSMPIPPYFQKVNPAAAPILYIALNSPTLPLSTVDEYAETYIAQRISMVSGVAQVSVYGAQKYAVRIQLDPNELAFRGIGIDEVSNAVQNQNVNLPVGVLSGAFKAYTVVATGQLDTAAAYRPVIVAFRNGSPVRLEQIGQALDSVENDRTASWYNGARAIMLAIQRQPGTNTVQVVDDIKKLLPTFRAEIPAAVKMDIVYDRSQSIRESVRDVQFTLLLAVVLVVLVIFLFLRNLSATIIPSLALPIAIIGTFGVMYMAGFSMDNLSLMALILAVGFIVDDAVVMLENIVRHMEAGEDPMNAALVGSREITFTIVSMTLSLVAVFIPVLFMGGILGRLFREFSITISVAILVSGLVSLTLTPMLGSRFLKHAPAAGAGRHRLYDYSERAFNAMLGFYERTLKWVLKRKFSTMMTAFVFLFLTVYLFKVIPTGFIPSEDIGMLMGFTEAIQGISFDDMVKHQKALAEVVEKDPNIDGFMSTVGGGSSQSPNTGRFFIRLKERRLRKVNADGVVQELRPKLINLPGIRAFLQNPPVIPVGGMMTKSQYQFTLQSPNNKELYKYAAMLEAKMRELPGLQDVNSDLQIANPQVDVDIDRDKAATLGVTAGQIEDAFFTAYGPRQISTIYAPNNQYKVLIELEDKYQMDPGSLDLLYIRSSQGQLIPLRNLAKLGRSVGPLSVNHLGQLPSVTISFNLRPDMPLGKAVVDVQKLADSVLPKSISTGFQGQAQAFKSSFQDLWLLLIMAILVIYIVLGVLYESFLDPVVILSALPFAGFGALLTVLIFRVQLTIYAFVGIIMLIGLVKKNGIMMIDFARSAQKEQDISSEQAILQACLIRFRPIMMTTMAALVGTLPIAIGFGAGASSRRPLGLAVVGGLLFSQLLTLFVTPVIYIYLDSLQQRYSRKKPAPAGAEVA